MYADQLSNLLHLRERDTRFVAVSRGEQEHLQRYREHMGWEFPWPPYTWGGWHDKYDHTL